jgi:FKBP-type peptidyl-prolyl cis-trans isomerase FkpA
MIILYRKLRMNNLSPCLKMILALNLVSLLSACFDTESDLEKRMKADDQKITKYLTDNNIQATKHEQGFYYQKLISHDAGEVLNTGEVVDFYYKMSLLDGTLVDQTLENHNVLSQFGLGYKSIVPLGLDYGVSMMKIGETFRFYIPSYLAYSYISNSKFEIYSNFIIDVEVVGKHTETEIDDEQLDSIDTYVKAHYTNYEKFASGLYYIETEAGTGDKPFSNSQVAINFTRKYLDGRVIRTTPKGLPSIFYIDNHEAAEGLEEGLLQMKKGGKATLIMPASIGFKESACIVPDFLRPDLLKDKEIFEEVLPYSIVMYDVELVTVNGY